MCACHYLYMRMKCIFYVVHVVQQHLCQIVDQGIPLQGDGNIRYYEVVDQAPWLHYLNQFLSGSPQVRFCYNGITVHPHLSVFMMDK